MRLQLFVYTRSAQIDECTQQIAQPDAKTKERFWSPSRYALRRGLAQALGVMKRAANSCVLVCSVALSACFSNHQPEQHEKLVPYERFDLWVIDNVAGTIGRTGPEIEGLGTLLSKEAAPWVPLHSEDCCEVVTYVFPGLEFTAVVDKQAPFRALPMRLKVTSNEWSLGEIPSVGEPIDELKTIEISPAPGTLKFCGTTECVEYTGSSIIESVEVRMYVD